MRSLPLFLILFHTSCLLAQDSLTIDLEAVTVQAFRGATVASRVAGSVATLDARVIEEFPTADLLPAMNRIPEGTAPHGDPVAARGPLLEAYARDAVHRRQ
ncbi:MAG: hypothetical protein AAFN92_08350 [Bacteroidota bacterium]